jgi:sulfate permease, SulP family
MNTVKNSPVSFFLQGILPIDKVQVPTDIIAGITLAALAIPEVMGYTRIAGMPVVTGLYTLLIPMALFALFGSSRHLVVGADSATAAIMAGGLAGLAAAASPEYVAYAGVLALMTAVLLLLARIIRLGFLTDFLSHTVLIGFLTGVGIQVAIGEISGILGLPGGGAGTLQKVVADFQQIGRTNPYTLGIAVVVIAIIAGTRKINRKIPGAFAAVIGAILISYFFNLPAQGVAVLGVSPSGLPKLGLPDIQLSLGAIKQLLPVSLSMFIVILTQSAATAHAYATRYGERLDENVDLVALGLANIGAGLSGAFVVNGSPTKTKMVENAGGRSQLVQITTAVVVLLVLLFLTGSLAYLPEAVLAAVVFLIGVELVDIKGMRRILVERPYEFWVALITTVAVVFLGVEEGILLAILLSLFIHTRHGYKPKNSLLMTDPDGNVRVAPIESRAQVAPGLMVYRFHHSMYYANTDFMTQEVLELANSAAPQLTQFCIDAIAVDDIDFTAAVTLRDLFKLLQGKGIRLALADLDIHVYTELERSDLINLLGKDAIFETAADAIQAYRLNAGAISLSPPPPQPPGR